MITFEQARTLAEQPARQMWAEMGGRGTFTVAATGAEDARSYLVVTGSQEAFDGDRDFLIYDYPLVFVDKATGAVTFEPVITNLDRSSTMTAVSG